MPKHLTLLFDALKVSGRPALARGLHYAQNDTSTKIIQLSPNERLASPQLQRLQPQEIKLFVGDWSGSFIDPHSIAPVEPMLEVFNVNGVPITVDEARLPMGLPKKEHIAIILKMPRVQASWFNLKKSKPTQNDVENIYTEFLKLELASLQKYTQLIPGTLEAVTALREMGVKIGCTTGFPKKIVERILESVKEKGFVPDASVAADMVKHGARPAPHMLFEIMDEVGVQNPSEVLKAGDTVVDVGEGLAAGTWTAGMWGASNHTGIESLEQLSKMPPSELAERQEHAKEILRKSGAHYLIEGPWQLPQLVKAVNLRIEEGETPSTELSKKAKPIILNSRVRPW